MAYRILRLSVLSWAYGLGITFMLASLFWRRGSVSPSLKQIHLSESYTYRGNMSVGALPVVLWHGMGDWCCGEHSIGAIKKHLEDTLPGVYVFSVSTAVGEVADREGSVFGNVNDQVTAACEALRNNPELNDGYNAVGFSQGSQFLRAVAERCQDTGPKMRTLVTLGGQHQGVMNAPACWGPSFNMTPTRVCGVVQRFLAWGAYLPFIRTHLVQAQYFKDPYDIPGYLLYNPFLPDVNNELPDKTPRYAVNLASLERLVLFRFSEDTMVVPRDSSWFSFYDGKRLVPLRESSLYKEDWIGLRALDEGGRLDLEECPGGHMHITLAWFKEHVVLKYLAPGGYSSIGSSSSRISHLDSPPASR